MCGGVVVAVNDVVRLRGVRRETQRKSVMARCPGVKCSRDTKLYLR